jgi:hypothetical protein
MAIAGAPSFLRAPKSVHRWMRCWTPGHGRPVRDRVFLSVRTVEWHLRKVFIKLDVRSRKDLKDAPPTHDPNAA